MLYEQRQIEHQLFTQAEKLKSIYTESDYHRNAGKWIRLIVKFIPLDFIFKLIQAKIK
jgi:hypothetical protein